MLCTYSSYYYDQCFFIKRVTGFNLSISTVSSLALSHFLLPYLTLFSGKSGCRKECTRQEMRTEDADFVVTWAGMAK